MYVVGCVAAVLVCSAWPLLQQSQVRQIDQVMLRRLLLEPLLLPQGTVLTYLLEPTKHPPVTFSHALSQP